MRVASLHEKTEKGQGPEDGETPDSPLDPRIGTSEGFGFRVHYDRNSRRSELL